MKVKQEPQSMTEPSAFWNTIPGQQASYLYAPGLMGSELMMGRFCPEYTAATGEKIRWKKGGHVIGQPHTCVAFSDVNLRKPTGFTLNPFTTFMHGIRRDLFPLAERFFGEKYGITVIDNPHSRFTVLNYVPKFAAANIGQTKDINTLHKYYNKHVKLHPNTNVILYGDSRGAATTFNFIALHKPQQIKAAVLEGIFDTVPHCIKHFAYDNKSVETEERLHQLLSMTMWKYRKNGINPRQCAETITDDIPLLFVTSLKDGICPPQGTIGLYKRLKERGHQKVHLLVLKDAFHPAYMMDNPEDKQLYETIVHAFYKHYNLPHNAHKAVKGQQPFLATQPAAKELAKLYPLPQCELCR